MSDYELYNYELYNYESAPSNTLIHGEIGAYELYHHGVKGQKWGVRRDRSSYTKQARSKRAAESIKRANDQKGAAVMRRLGRSVGAHFAQSFIGSAGSSALAGIAMATVSTVPPVTVAAGAASVALAATYTVGEVKNAYRTVRDVYDISAYNPKTKSV